MSHNKTHKHFLPGMLELFNELLIVLLYQASVSLSLFALSVMWSTASKRYSGVICLHLSRTAPAASTSSVAWLFFFIVFFFILSIFIYLFICWLFAMLVCYTMFCLPDLIGALSGWISIRGKPLGRVNLSCIHSNK